LHIQLKICNFFEIFKWSKLWNNGMMEKWNIGIYERIISVLKNFGQDEYCHKTITPLSQTLHSMIP